MRVEDMQDSYKDTRGDIQSMQTSFTSHINIILFQCVDKRVSGEYFMEPYPTLCVQRSQEITRRRWNAIEIFSNTYM